MTGRKAAAKRKDGDGSPADASEWNKKELERMVTVE